MKNRRKEIVEDAGVIGWISISEVFLLCGVTMLTIALVVSSNLKKTKDVLVMKTESEIPGLKKTIEQLNSQIPALKKTVEELNEDKGRAKQMMAKLKEQIIKSDRETLELTSRIKKLEDELKENGSVTVAQLRASLAALTSEKTALAADLKDRQTEIVLARSEKAALQKKVGELEKRIIEINESVFVPPRSTQLIVKIYCKDLPAGYDLDLYVEDPHDQVCYFDQPRTKFEDKETGLLILSEDLRNLHKTAEEIYHSKTVEFVDADHPYLIGGMIRSISETDDAPSITVTLHWEIWMASEGPPKLIKSGTRPIKSGGVFYNKITQRYQYPGLVPLAGFQRPSAPDQPPSFKALDEIRQFPRSWSSQTDTGPGVRYKRIQDPGQPGTR